MVESGFLLRSCMVKSCTESSNLSLSESSIRPAFSKPGFLFVARKFVTEGSQIPEQTLVESYRKQQDSDH